METKVKDAIKEYQCSGCTNGSFPSCFTEYGSGVGCGSHHAGTIMMPIGFIFLGLPKGFNRLGPVSPEHLKPRIFKTYEDSKYNKWNIPTWKHLNEDGHTLVRGISPRTNLPFTDIFLEDCVSKIDCLEISQEEINAMD